MPGQYSQNYIPLERPTPRRKLVLACALAFAGALVASPGLAVGPAQCPEGRGIYQAVMTPSHEMAFAGEKGTLTLTKGRTRVSFSFAVTSTNGFSRTNIELPGKDAPTSVLMSFNPDFTPYRGEGSAPYLVTPDLPVSFYYWEPFRSRPDFMDLLPGDAWHLVRCATGVR
jgi:hypothetical protein